MSIEIEARDVRFFGRTAVADAVATQGAGGRVVALARGHFIHSTHPGGSISEPIDWAGREIFTEGGFDSFSSYLGVQSSGEDLLVHPRERLQGAVAVQAYHGGVIAATMDLAGRVFRSDLVSAESLLMRSLTVQYLRPSIATMPLVVTPQATRVGRSAATIEAVARCGLPGSPVTAIGLMTLLTEPLGSPSGASLPR
ncbi:hotdog domain-containing protein [Sphingomonas sp. ID0503]